MTEPLGMPPASRWADGIAPPDRHERGERLGIPGLVSRTFCCDGVIQVVNGVRTYTHGPGCLTVHMAVRPGGVYRRMWPVPLADDMGLGAGVPDGVRYWDTSSLRDELEDDREILDGTAPPVSCTPMPCCNGVEAVYEDGRTVQDHRRTCKVHDE